MSSPVQDRWSKVKDEWGDLERHERIHVIWGYTNLAATVILPLLLLFVFIMSAPRLPSVNTLLVMIGIGLIYGGSVTVQDPIMNRLSPSEDESRR
jgi:hypothetical protein